MPKTMRAIEIATPGGPEQLTPTTRPCPEPGPTEVLIEVSAAGVNRPDILQRKGLYPPPEGASDLPGLEVSGRIIKTGANVTNKNIGDQVCALLPGGGYAQYAVADAGLCMTIPEGIDLIDAAGLPETIITVWANVFDDGQLQPHETLLVHGGTSGIGMSAISMAKAWGASVITTAGSKQKVNDLLAYGVDAAYQYNDDDWQSEIIKSGGVDVVLDMAGGEFVAKNIACLKLGGRHISIAFLRGIQAEISILPIMLNRLKISGSTLRSRTPKEKAKLIRNVEEKIWPLFASGKMTSSTYKTFPLEEAAKAHEMMEAGTHRGKILLLP